LDITVEGFLMYSVGSSLKDWEFLVPQESMDTWAKILDDPNPIHLDVNSVKSLGLGDKTINQGPANIAYIMNMLEQNFPNSQIIKMNNKMTNSILEGELVNVSGQILNIKEKKSQLIISCTLKLTAEGGKIAVISEVDLLVKKD
jgi:acyl dehydratase